MNGEVLFIGCAALVLFGFSDWVQRTAPGIELFFLAAVLLGAQVDPLGVFLTILAAGWGWLAGVPWWIGCLGLLHPASAPVVIAAAGFRRRMLGGADLLALAGIACLFEWPTVWMALAGAALVRRWWTARRAGSVPALMGMAVGLLIYVATAFLLGMRIPAWFSNG